MSQGFGEQYDKTEEEEEKEQQQQQQPKKTKMQFPLFSHKRNRGQVMMRNGT